MLLINDKKCGYDMVKGGCYATNGVHCILQQHDRREFYTKDNQSNRY